jgi:Ni,Fe-hydrogenase I small subunit
LACRASVCATSCCVTGWSAHEILWLQAAGCGGCTQSLLGAENRSGMLAQFADSGLDFVLHPGLSEASGDEALALLQAAAAGRLPFDILCVEGALLRGPNGSGRFQMLSGSGRPVIDWVRELAARASHVLAIGTCSAYGGIIPPAKTSPTPAVCSSTATRKAACSARTFARLPVCR